ncbi:expressed unknown protein [Seminavis robusta]|uniref:DEP domain-containing protein n=1 Tax=Seminavis robusta TaxID=568900 RepID=A0A9N8F1I5_9STRA|nr:expressed unknown protein [Seminavis robusta]|eukprot:Sro2637_g333330.1 n/a (428) ;mRNA; r:7838-9121
MPETSTARAVVDNNKPTVVSVGMANYQISDSALKSLRDSRHSIRRGGIPNRHHSGGSNNSKGATAAAAAAGSTTPPGGALDTSRKSNRSSQSSSIWSNIMGRGRRIYGSVASVASSITLTEFDGNFSEEFEISEGSLDIRQLNFVHDEEQVDSQPMLPQRQTSVTAGQSSSLMSTSDLSKLSHHVAKLGTQHEQQQEQQEQAPPPGSSRSSDLSPRQPGRKTSIKTLSSECPSAPTLEPNSNHTNKSNNHNNRQESSEAPFGRSNSKDSVPQFPCRKKSSKLVAESIKEELLSAEFRDQASSFLEAMQPILGKHSDSDNNNNTFTGALAIDSMLESGMVDSRQEAVEVGQAIQQTGELFYHISGTKKPFADSSEDVYVMAPKPPPPPPLRPCMMSVRRKTDTSISIEEESPLQVSTAKHISVPHVKR